MLPKIKDALLNMKVTAAIQNNMRLIMPSKYIKAYVLSFLLLFNSRGSNKRELVIASLYRYDIVFLLFSEQLKRSHKPTLFITFERITNCPTILFYAMKVVD